MEWFGLSVKETSKLLLMLIIAFIVWGFVGLFLIGLMQFVSMQGWATDSVHKHGIAEMQASRLGGAVCILGGFLVVIMLKLNGADESGGSGPFGIRRFVVVAIMGSMVLGLVEDIRNDSLSPRIRLGILAILFGFILWQWPALVPSSIGAPILDSLLSIPALAFVLCLVFCVGFLNAVNMADGANGLVPSILLAAYIIFYQEYGGVGLLSAVTILSAFWIFNVVSGRLFLGDAGAYAFGASLLVSSLTSYANGIMSLSFLAALLCYPCLDFLFSIVRRLVNGRPIMKPDNDHLHNRIHFQYRKFIKSKNIANSAAGLTVAGASSGVVLWGYLAAWWPINSGQWIVIFAAQSVAYGLAYYLTSSSSLAIGAANQSSDA
ncbi:MAG: MraY family glycosyltransferase [Porticoccaceae bacterium]|nr:MraY family glycosyltransferase [Porticoccaceae bacterium]